MACQFLKEPGCLAPSRYSTKRLWNSRAQQTNFYEASLFFSSPANDREAETATNPSPSQRSKPNTHQPEPSFSTSGQAKPTHPQPFRAKPMNCPIRPRLLVAPGGSIWGRRPGPTPKMSRAMASNFSSSTSCCPARQAWQRGAQFPLLAAGDKKKGAQTGWNPGKRRKKNAWTKNLGPPGGSILTHTPLVGVLFLAPGQYALLVPSVQSCNNEGKAVSQWPADNTARVSGAAANAQTACKRSRLIGPKPGQVTG